MPELDCDETECMLVYIIDWEWPHKGRGHPDWSQKGTVYVDSLKTLKSTLDMFFGADEEGYMEDGVGEPAIIFKISVDYISKEKFDNLEPFEL